MANLEQSGHIVCNTRGGRAWVIPPTSKQTPKEPNQIGLKFPATNNGSFSVKSEQAVAFNLCKFVRILLHSDSKVPIIFWKDSDIYDRLIFVSNKTETQSDPKTSKRELFTKTVKVVNFCCEGFHCTCLRESCLRPSHVHCARKINKKYIIWPNHRE